MVYSAEQGASQYIDKINAETFTDIALELFRYQYAQNVVYRSFVDALKVSVANVRHIEAIPFLPVSFFKTHVVTAREGDESKLIFESSGTTGEVPSRHHLYSPDLYEASLIKGFEQFYGRVSDYAILALLPSYLERKNASLVHMAETLMKKSGHSSNGFYLNEWEKLHFTITELEEGKQPTLLLGVTFALLDFASLHPMNLRHTIVMETGGMKGRKEEWTRPQVHEFLKDKWNLQHVHSEYGMTELLSQAYALKDGIFACSPSMKVLVGDINDPLEVNTYGTGCLNIIDLANVDSCAFIATEDIGTVHHDGTFEVLGRMDHSALRGCSLMTA